MPGKNDLVKLGLHLTACPTAPGHEFQVRRLVQDMITGLPKVKSHLDEFGNLHVFYRNRSAGREAFRLVAHLDHPGFIRYGHEIHFAGGVAEPYFIGKKVVFFQKDDAVPLARSSIVATEFSPTAKRVIFASPVPPEAVFGQWDLPGPVLRGPLFLSPACDDLIQVTLMIHLLRRLALEDAPGNIELLFTRAEEVGFCGALAALASRKKLSPLPTLSLEASPARGFARQGAGPIVRVGDRLTVFDSQVTHWLENAFQELKVIHPLTTYQRLLMGGGACEAFVFHRAGFPTGALCVGLDYYHNMGPGRSVRRESISLQDWLGLSEFLYFLTTRASSPSQAEKAVTRRFTALRKKALHFLRDS